MRAAAISSTSMVDERVLRFAWHPVHPDTVIRESASVGLGAERLTEELLILRTM